MNSSPHLFHALCIGVFVISGYLALAGLFNRDMRDPHLTDSDVNSVGFAALAIASVWLAGLTAAW
jgi:hypothetical protein